MLKDVGVEIYTMVDKVKRIKIKKYAKIGLITESLLYLLFKVVNNNN